MKTHQYHIALTWTGNTGNGTQSYTSYTRDHILKGKGKTTLIPGSSDPAFRGDPSRYNPEELFLSSIASCHMLWYLHLCAANDICVLQYQDEPTAIMKEDHNGSGRFESVTLHPLVTVSEQHMLENAILLHREAHDKCFIANSCNFRIRHKPVVKLP